MISFPIVKAGFSGKRKNIFFSFSLKAHQQIFAENHTAKEKLNLSSTLPS